MNRRLSRLILAAMLIAGAAATTAQETHQTTAPRRSGRAVPQQQVVTDDPPKANVLDTAVAELVGWKTAKGTAIIEAAEEDQGDTPEFKAATALLLCNKGKVQQALDRFSAVSDSAKNDPMPAYFAGQILQQQKKYDDAVAAWTDARNRATAQVTTNPKNARAQYYLGAASARLKKNDQAAQAIIAAADNTFDQRLCNLQLGMIHAVAKEWQDAKEAFDKILEQDPLFAPAYFHRGMAWSKLGRNDKMAEDLDRFIQLAPTSPEADMARALLGAYAG